MKTKLTACKACSHMISKTASKCPQCGNARTSVPGLLFLALVTVFVIMTVGGGWRFIARLIAAEDQIGAAEQQLGLSHDQYDRIMNQGIKTPEEIQRSTDDIIAANEILDAKDKADAAERDNADAAAIRGN